MPHPQVACLQTLDSARVRLVSPTSHLTRQSGGPVPPGRLHPGGPAEGSDRYPPWAPSGHNTVAHIL
jgi:hypothetical protein